jgi:adenylate kinase
MMANVIFLGAPGSGKGTQALILAKDLNIPTISTGEILRKEVSEKTEIGQLAKSYMDKGGLVPDQIVVGMIKNRISLPDCKNGFILDGFPRNLAQGQALDKMLGEIGKNIDAVIDISVPDDVIVKRISGRFSCKSCGAVYNRFF